MSNLSTSPADPAAATHPPFGPLEPAVVLDALRGVTGQAALAVIFHDHGDRGTQVRQTLVAIIGRLTDLRATLGDSSALLDAEDEIAAENLRAVWSARRPTPLLMPQRRPASGYDALEETHRAAAWDRKAAVAAARRGRGRHL